MEGTGTSTRVLSFSSRAALGAGTSFSAMRFAPFVARHTNDRASPMSRCAMWSALPRSASQRHARSYTHFFHVLHIHPLASKSQLWEQSQ